MPLLWLYSIPANGSLCLHAQEIKVTMEMQFAWNRILLWLFAEDRSSLSTKQDYTLSDIMRLFKKMELRIFRPFNSRRMNVYNCFSHLAESGANNTARYIF